MNENSSTSGSPRWWMDGFVIVSLLVYFLLLSRSRIIAGDEGFYVMAARLTAEGRLPYLDFFYPQMPLMPFMYGGWLSLLGTGWLEVRSLSAIFAALTGLLLFWRVSLLIGRSYGLFSVLLFVTSELVISEYAIAKTYSATVFFVFAAYFLLCRQPRLAATGALAVGALVGLGINVRLTTLGLLPVFALPVIFGRQPFSDKMRLTAVFGLGVIAALALALFLFYYDYQAFWFNNLGYHFERTSLSASELWSKRWRVLSVIIGYESSARYDGFILPLLFWGNIFYGGISLLKRWPLDLAFLISIFIIAIALVPSPCYLQYVCIAVPFLIVTTLLFANALFGYIRKLPWSSGLIAAIVVVMTSQFIFSFYLNVKRYCFTGQRVIGISTGTVDRWKITTMQQLGAVVDSYIEQGDLVIAPLPLHIFATKAGPLPGLENHFGLSHGRRQRANDGFIDRFKLISPQMVAQAISSQQAKLLVVTSSRRSSVINKAVANSNYNLVADVAGILVYRRHDMESPVDLVDDVGGS